MSMPDQHELFSADVINEIDGAFRMQELARYSQAAVDLRRKVSGFLATHDALIGNRGIAGFILPTDELKPPNLDDLKFPPLHYETWVELKRPLDSSGKEITDDRVPSVVRIVTNHAYSAPDIVVKGTEEVIKTRSTLSKDVTLDAANQASLFLGIANLDIARGVSTDVNGSASIISHNANGTIEVVDIGGQKRLDGYVYQLTDEPDQPEVIINDLTARDMLHALDQGNEMLLAVSDIRRAYRSIPRASA